MLTKPDLPFEPFAKIPRLNRRIIVTEKIDGTNALIYIPDPVRIVQPVPAPGPPIHAGSRKRWITPEDDNYGFARWVDANQEELMQLGPGHHFGEWWGQGIQRKYGLDHKRFSLFNTYRWGDGGVDTRPACCHVVPVLYDGSMDTDKIRACLDWLEEDGSRAAPGFVEPEGVMAYHVTAGSYFKVTITGDEKPKGAPG